MTATRVRPRHLEWQDDVVDPGASAPSPHAKSAMNKCEEYQQHPVEWQHHETMGEAPVGDRIRRGQLRDDFDFALFPEVL
ncbi:MAG: hypothetical protein NT069_15425 [Planctomycetota bacterium]|nr:hypothetical protein [Planctomycetota bacterium]